jgi:hypothetical protein
MAPNEVESGRNEFSILIIFQHTVNTIEIIQESLVFFFHGFGKKKHPLCLLTIKLAREKRQQAFKSF